MAEKCPCLSLVTLTFDLWPWLSNSASEGPNTSSVWIWCKSVQRFPRYFTHRQKKPQTDCAKNRTFSSSLRALKMPAAKCRMERQTDRPLSRAVGREADWDGIRAAGDAIELAISAVNSSSGAQSNPEPLRGGRRASNKSRWNCVRSFDHSAIYRESRASHSPSDFGRLLATVERRSCVRVYIPTPKRPNSTCSIRCGFVVQAVQQNPHLQSIHNISICQDFVQQIDAYRSIRKLQPGIERVQALADISRSRCVAIATKPVHRLQICPIVHN